MIPQAIVSDIRGYNLHFPTFIDVFGNGIMHSVRKVYYSHDYGGKTNGLGDLPCSFVAVFLDQRLGLVKPVKKAPPALSTILLHQG